MSSRQLSAPCHLLQVPLEIRLSIYRNLLLDPCVAYLSSRRLVFEDNSLSETRDPLSDEAEHHGAESDHKDDDCQWDNCDKFAAKRHLAILRVNHQIYAEASSLMYSDLEVVLEPGDVVGFDHGTDIVDQHKQVWRHSPLPSKDEGAPSLDVMDGLLEPYIFARFQNIKFRGDFYFNEAEPHNAPHRTLFVNRDLTVRSEYETNFASLLRSSSTLQNLAQILSMNTVIKRLNFSLTLSVEPEFDSDYEDLDFDQVSEIIDRRCDVAWKRSYEIFIEAGMLHQLCELANVQNFHFVVLDPDSKSGVLELPHKHAAKVREVKEMIERNYSAKQACLNNGEHCVKQRCWDGD